MGSERIWAASPASQQVLRTRDGVRTGHSCTRRHDQGISTRLCSAGSIGLGLCRRVAFYKLSILENQAILSISEVGDLFLPLFS